jgi:O-antigen ligase
LKASKDHVRRDTLAAMHATDLRDPLYLTARGLLYISLFANSILLARIGSFTIGDFALAGSLLLLVTARGTNRSINWPKSPYPLWGTAIVLSLFVIGALLSTYRAQLPTESVAVTVRIILVAFLLPWMARALLPAEKYLRRALTWLLCGAALTAFGTLAQAAGIDVPGGMVTIAGRYSGLTGHVSDMGGIASMGIAVGIGFIIARGTVPGRFTALLLTAVLLVGLILSGSVSGMIAVVVAVLIYLLRGAIKPGAAILFLLIGIAVLAVTSTIQSAAGGLGPVERFLRALGLTDNGLYATSDIRSETYDAAWASIIQNPIFGQGMDTSSAVADGRFPVHNLLLASLFQGGLLVLIALAAMITRPIRSNWWWGGRDRSLLGTQLLATAAGAFVFAMTAPSMYNRYFWVPVALLGVARALSPLVDANWKSSLDPSAARAAEQHPDHKARRRASETGQNLVAGPGRR